MSFGGRRLSAWWTACACSSRAAAVGLYLCGSDGELIPGLLEAKNITVQFGHGADAFNALHDVNFVVYPREAVGIVGESGSGKTTLARVLIGLQRPTVGEVSIEGTRVFSPDSKHQMTRSER